MTSLLVIILTVLLQAFLVNSNETCAAFIKTKCGGKTSVCPGAFVSSTYIVAGASCFQECKEMNNKEIKVFPIMNILGNFQGFDVGTRIKIDSCDVDTEKGIIKCKLADVSEEVNNTCSITPSCKMDSGDDVMYSFLGFVDGKTVRISEMAAQKPRFCKKTFDSYNREQHNCIAASRCIKNAQGIVYRNKMLYGFGMFASDCSNGDQSNYVTITSSCGVTADDPSTTPTTNSPTTTSTSSTKSTTVTTTSPPTTPPPAGCPNPPPLLGAIITAPTRPKHGDKATYSCLPPAKTEGNNILTCENGKWTGSRPRCVQSDSCPQITVPNGYVDRASVVEIPGGKYSTVKCNPGYQLDSSNDKMVCFNGKWTGPVPNCRSLSCPPLSNIPNGRVQFSTRKSCTSFATYSCNAGYLVSGVVRVRCGCNGKWEAGPPKCVKNTLCGQYGRISCGSTQNRGGVTTGATVTYQPAPGVKLCGESTITCLPNGQWSAPTPRCQIQCKGNTISNGGYSIVERDNCVDYDMVMKCDPGYRMCGRSSYTCSDGKLDGRPAALTTCRGSCQSLDIPNSKIKYTNVCAGLDTATVTCDPGYCRQGFGTLYCLPGTLEWLFEAKCVRC